MVGSIWPPSFLDVQGLSQHIQQAVQHNTSIVAMNNDFNELSFLEYLFIKMHKPKLNTGIRTCFV